MAKQQVLIPIPPGFTPDEREKIARDIINFIRDRTATDQKGYDPDTKRNYSLRSVPYSDKYADKKGVGTKDVDLLLSGDMLDAIEELRITPTSITIGITDKEQAAKAEGNQIGSYGGSPNPDKARPFLGIAPKDLKEILSKYE
jgi:hypothetical protein